MLLVSTQADFKSIILCTQWILIIQMITIMMIIPSDALTKQMIRNNVDWGWRRAILVPASCVCVCVFVCTILCAMPPPPPSAGNRQTNSSSVQERILFDLCTMRSVASLLRCVRHRSNWVCVWRSRRWSPSNNNDDHARAAHVTQSAPAACKTRAVCCAVCSVLLCDESALCKSTKKGHDDLIFIIIVFA